VEVDDVRANLDDLSGRFVAEDEVVCDTAITNPTGFPTLIR
jgi:hypothetical protein